MQRVFNVSLFSALRITSLQRRLGGIFLSFLLLFASSAPYAFAAVNYLYDANGNMTSDGQYCYTYNEANELSIVKNCSTNQTIAQYIYDGNGQRLEKKLYTNGVLASTVYSPTDDFQTVKNATNGATQNTTYYSANGQLLAQKNPDGSKYYYQNDHLGSASLMTDASGAMVEQTNYDPYGLVLAGGTKEKFQYTGQEKDQETPLNYYNARYYDSQIQHFTQPDTLLANVYDPQQLNRYSYTRDNPLRYTDPSGHCLPECLIPIVTGLIGGIIAGGAEYIHSGGNLKKTGAAFVAGAIAGAVAPIVAAEAAEASAGVLARTILPKVVQSVLSWGIGVAASTGVSTGITSTVQHQDPRQNFTQNLFIDAGTDIITDGAVPDGSITTSVLKGVSHNPSLGKIAAHEAVSDTISTGSDSLFDVYKERNSKSPYVTIPNGIRLSNKDKQSIIDFNGSFIYQNYYGN